MKRFEIQDDELLIYHARIMQNNDEAKRAQDELKPLADEISGLYADFVCSHLETFRRYEIIRRKAHAYQHKDTMLRDAFMAIFYELFPDADVFKPHFFKSDGNQVFIDEMIDPPELPRDETEGGT